MSKDQLSEPFVRVHVQNIGGIDEAEAAISPGVSVLSGRNATNRTSFLQALMAALGSKRSSLKGDAKKGSVTVELDDETHTRTLTRKHGTVDFSGDPYLDDPEVADLFAFLLGNNEARRAVTHGDDLREIIMRPIDTDRIETEIKTCKQQRDDIESEIERLNELEQKLPELEATRRKTKTELKTAGEELESVQAELDALDANVEESRTRKQELEEAFQRVRDARSELEDLEFDLETERATLSELTSEREDLEETLAEVEETEEDPDQLAGQIDELRRRKRALGDTISELGSVINFNEDMLKGEGFGVDDAVGQSTDARDLTSALTATDEVVCWTCGSEVSSEQIEATLNELRELRSSKVDERGEVRSKITELTDRQSKLKEHQRERERAERRLSEIDSEIESTLNRIEDFETTIEEKESQIEELEAEAESITFEDHDEALELHREANSIELRIDRLEDELSEINTEIEAHEAAIEERESLKQEREDLTRRLTELRTRVERTEEDAVESFNEHMEMILDVLDYDNLERIWIERRETEVSEGRRKVNKTRFDLHIVRTATDGTAYEDTIDHLSESEREVTGLVFALAGYLVHDVNELVPFIILDSLEAIDSARIASLVDYFCDHADFLVAALLPEDANALPDTYHYIDSLN